jgi:succinyl-CoA synthetase alpha subunit
MCRDYANGKAAFVAGVNPKKAGEDFEGIPIFASVTEAKKETGANVSVIYVPPAGAAAAIWKLSKLKWIWPSASPKAFQSAT